MEYRCTCKKGGCWDCWKDTIEERYIVNHIRDCCDCDEPTCEICVFYQELDEKYNHNSKWLAVKDPSP